MPLPQIIDSYGRMFKTLRLSLTNSCNLGCVYCVSGNDPENLIEENVNVLSLNEILELVNRLHLLLNLKVIRLTGGEPTLFRELIPLIQGIKDIGIPSIKMTSNGFLLENKARLLAKAGLTHLNVSLDAIDPEEFFNISRRRNIQKILVGIDEAIHSGIDVKINSVVMKGLNENQILPLLDYAFKNGIQIRFLELMRMGHLQTGSFKEHFYSEDEILETITQKYKFKKLSREKSSTANYWETESGKVFGIVANETEPFCHDCNRLRLDSYGNIFGCLSENAPISIIESKNNTVLSEKLIEALHHKQSLRFKGSEISMLAIGG